MKSTAERIFYGVLAAVTLGFGGFAYQQLTKPIEHTYYMYGVVGTPTNYKELADYLNNLSKNDTVHIRLLGPGGNADTISYLDNLIKQDGPKVVTHVDGDVASADAMIAMLGDDIQIGENSYFMFHRPILVDNKGQEISPSQICQPYTGVMDRGQDAYKKCLDSITYYNKSLNNSLKKGLKYLTAEELKRYEQGYDVYITGSDMKERIKTWDLA